VPSFVPGHAAHKLTRKIRRTGLEGWVSMRSGRNSGKRRSAATRQKLGELSIMLARDLLL
jgi:hypothetical protein